MKVEVDELGSPSLIFLTVSVDEKQHLKKLDSYEYIHFRRNTK